MNYDRYIKMFIIGLSKSDKFFDISVTTIERYNPDYETVTKSILLQYSETTKKTKTGIEYCKNKVWCKNKQELVKELNNLWERRQNRRQTKNKKK